MSHYHIRILHQASALVEVHVAAKKLCPVLGPDVVFSKYMRVRLNNVAFRLQERVAERFQRNDPILCLCT